LAAQSEKWPRKSDFRRAKWILPAQAGKRPRKMRVGPRKVDFRRANRKWAAQTGFDPRKTFRCPRKVDFQCAKRLAGGSPHILHGAGGGMNYLCPSASICGSISL
jgi:hypothetical protein